jgi:rod shape-determining protein MreD
MAIYYFGFPLLLLAAVFDTTIMTLLRFWGGTPNLVLIVVVSWALIAEIEEAIPWAVMGGIFRDLLSVAPTGSSALTLIIIVIVIDQFFPKLDWRNLVIPPLVVIGATIFFDLVLLGVLVLLGWPLPRASGAAYVIIPGIFENVLIIPFVFRAIGGINHFLRPPRASLLD